MEQINKRYSVVKKNLYHIGSSKKQSGDKKPSKISGPKQLEQYTAVADYEAQEKGEASLQAGMTVEVVEKSESGKSFHIAFYLCVYGKGYCRGQWKLLIIGAVCFIKKDFN